MLVLSSLLISPSTYPQYFGFAKSSVHTLYASQCAEPFGSSLASPKDKHPPCDSVGFHICLHSHVLTVKCWHTCRPSHDLTVTSHHHLHLKYKHQFNTGSSTNFHSFSHSPHFFVFCSNFLLFMSPSMSISEDVWSWSTFIFSAPSPYDTQDNILHAPYLSSIFTIVTWCHENAGECVVWLSVTGWGWVCVDYRGHIGLGWCPRSGGNVEGEKRQQVLKGLVSLDYTGQLKIMMGQFSMQ